MEKLQPSINDESAQRTQKLANLQQARIEVYPARVKSKQSIADVLAKFEVLLAKQNKVSLAGRVRALRLHGGSCFLDIEDGSGKIQIFIKKDLLGDKKYQLLVDNLDSGDFLYFSGKAFATRTGQPTILIDSYNYLAKTLRPIPDDWSGFKDVEARFRKRYLDLIVNDKAKQIFKLRSQVIKNIRDFFEKQGFIEVDTPMLQSVAGGAAAKPFVTHHNALDIDLYLRVAPELYLKRLIVGGFEQVFEIARCFRNEGISLQHNPEFTQIEYYWAYKDYKFLMKFTEKFFEQLLKKINDGKLEIKNGLDTINFQAPYPVWDYRQMILDHFNIDLDKISDAELLELANKEGLKAEASWGRGRLIDELYKKRIRKKIIQPTFIINHPIELSPLAKKIPDRPKYVERFQLVIKGAEICNAFSEINDPLDQEERFKEQKKLQQRGDDEAMGADDDFVEALRYGMPPTAGLGMGIDRLVMLLADTDNIKEVILFPTLKPKV